MRSDVCKYFLFGWQQQHLLNSPDLSDLCKALVRRSAKGLGTGEAVATDRCSFSSGEVTVTKRSQLFVRLSQAAA